MSSGCDDARDTVQRVPRRHRRPAADNLGRPDHRQGLHAEGRL